MSAPSLAGPVTESYLTSLKAIFRSEADKRRAHAAARDVLGDLARNPTVLQEAIEAHLSTPGALNRRHFPVVSFPVDSNPFFDLVFNCWIPLPDRSTDISTKSIHHHGPMLLTTSTVFGPGYEHWMLAGPTELDAERSLFKLDLLEHGRHGLYEVAFVDAYVAHVPIYPESLTITVCLWSNSAPTTWRDHVKRIPSIQRHSSTLRRLTARAGLAKQLDLKVDDYKDYYPTDAGFIGMKDREEFPYTNNEDYLYSLFHIVQATGNGDLANRFEAVLSAPGVDNPAIVRQLLDDLRAERPIEARLSSGHYGVPYANFSRADIERALAAQPAA